MAKPIEEMSLVDMINSDYYPNALAKLKVSMRDLSIRNVGLTQDGIDSMKKDKNTPKRKDDTKSKKIKVSKDIADEVDLMWKHMGLGNIDVSYACSGYTLDGRPVLNQGEFINLLLNYGFSMHAIALFVDDFAKQSMKTATSPIIMYSANTAKIMADIEPIVKNKHQ